MNKNVDVEEILNSKSNTAFRRSSGKDVFLFDSQITTAKAIVKELANRTLRTNHVMLVAKMQSGKTGVCNSVVNILTETKLDMILGIDKFMFVSGMNDCGLKDQTFIRLRQQVIKANADNVYVGKHSKRNLSPNKFFILKNSDLLAYDGNVNNTLIFIDEAHYGSNENNVLTKFLEKHGINWKNTNELVKRNIYIVSISATPFDELVSDTVECKKMIELKTTENYVGVSEFLNKDLVYSANKDDVTVEGKIFEYIEDAHQRMVKNNNGVGVIFVRTRNFDVIKNNPFVCGKFDIHEMFSGGTNIEYDLLNETMNNMVIRNEYNKKRPTLNIKDVVDLPIADVKPLIVLIKGAFRAGITIDAKYKDYIYMVYDYSVKSDTTAQALLGRMCGYRDTETCKIENTHFYINKQYADMYSTWEGDFTNRDAIPCNKMKYEWVDNDFVGTDSELGTKSCGNFDIPLSDEEIISIYTNGKGKKNRVEFMEYKITEIFNAHGIQNVSYDYICEVVISGKNNYALSSRQKRFEDFSSESLIFQFRPFKMPKFMEDNNGRDYLTKDDLGKKCISLVLDAEIYENDDTLTIEGNKRLLVYYGEVGQKIRVANRKGMYKAHKDTNVPKDKKTIKKLA